LIGFIITYIGAFIVGDNEPYGADSAIVGLSGLLPHGAVLAVLFGLIIASLCKSRTTRGITISSIIFAVLLLMGHIIITFIFGGLLPANCLPPPYYGSYYGINYGNPVNVCNGWKTFEAGVVILTIGNILVLITSVWELKRSVPLAPVGATIVYVNVPPQQQTYNPQQMPSIGQTFITANGQTVMVVPVEPVTTKSIEEPSAPLSSDPPPYSFSATN